ncbi:signal peptidase complex subunit spc2 [Emydomyces testavorans]|uniref:Signal peptidase complex subunit 2 n=1 Tax=Emydomyces testavorans TaxID=2070801 RepID=A0AAF0IJ00_9EURO|nr:signal peptidase complex subunit spc2 [Emydomyces testavorans]
MLTLSALELKSTTDDAVAPYLATLPKPYTFIADNTKSNVRLMLGYGAVSIAAVSFYIDYTKGWQATKPWILPAVIAYFVMNLALTIWIWGIEAGQVFEGSKIGGERLRLCSSAKKYSPLYNLRILRTSALGETLQEKNIAAPFTQWFSADGVFQREAFKQWLAGEIGVPAPVAGPNLGN